MMAARIAGWVGCGGGPLLLFFPLRLFEATGLEEGLGDHGHERVPVQPASPGAGIMVFIMACMESIPGRRAVLVRQPQHDVVAAVAVDDLRDRAAVGERLQRLGDTRRRQPVESVGKGCLDNAVKGWKLTACIE